ncbi:MAG: PHB depolymerase family esterase [Dokdonella sp.]
MTKLNPSLQHAMRLMQSGDLQAATRAIQLGLSAGGAPPARNDDGFQGTSARAESDIIDGEFVVVDRVDTSNQRDDPSTATSCTQGAFDSRRHVGDGGELDYKLYVPAGLDTANAPLLLMLHGCTQSPDDFARGTRMNTLAGAHGYVVAYPEQSSSRNANRCWNWFRSSDQQRGSGEPALLAALTRQLITTHHLDERRVYVAGLSAGGAMSAVLANTHPDLFAAIGVHSGLPIGLASDVPSAFAAMRSGGSRRVAIATNSISRPVPAIVFHGDRDSTVHSGNGHGVIAQSLADHGVDAAAAKGANVERGIAAGGRHYTRTVHRLADGSIAAEHWIIAGAGHAWSGGDASGSYTDSTGPDASAQMLRFFSECAK